MIFSKKLLVIIGARTFGLLSVWTEKNVHHTFFIPYVRSPCPFAATILVLTGLAFFWIEQARIMKNNAASRTTLQQIAAIKGANEQLEKAKLDMQAEEDECVVCVCV